MPQGYPPPEGSPVNVTSTSVEPAAGAKANATWLVLPRLPTIDAPPDSLSGEWCRLRGAGHTTNSLAFGYPRGEGSQPLGSDVEHLGLLWEPLSCAGLLRCWIKRRAWAYYVKEGFQCHCRLPIGPLKPFKKYLPTLPAPARFRFAADVQGGQPSRFRLSRSSPGRCCR